MTFFDIKVNNIVSVAILSKPVRFVERYRDKKKLVIKFPKKGRGTGVIIAHDGVYKLVVNGARSVEEAQIIAKVGVKYLIEHGMLDGDTEIRKIEIANIVVHADIGYDIDIYALLECSHIGPIIYEPGRFPGVIYIVPKPYTGKALLFSNGKIVIQGAKDLRRIRATLHYIFKVLSTNKLLKPRKKRRIRRKL